MIFSKELEKKKSIHKDIFACLFSIHNTISLSCHYHVLKRKVFILKEKDAGLAIKSMGINSEVSFLRRKRFNETLKCMPRNLISDP